MGQGGMGDAGMQMISRHMRSGAQVHAVVHIGGVQHVLHSVYHAIKSGLGIEGLGFW